MFAFALTPQASTVRAWTPPGTAADDPGPVFRSAFTATTGDPASGLAFFAGEFGAPRNDSLPLGAFDQVLSWVWCGRTWCIGNFYNKLCHKGLDFCSDSTMELRVNPLS